MSKARLALPASPLENLYVAFSKGDPFISSPLKIIGVLVLVAFCFCGDSGPEPLEISQLLIGQARGEADESVGDRKEQDTKSAKPFGGFNAGKLHRTPQHVRASGFQLKWFAPRFISQPPYAMRGR